MNGKWAQSLGLAMRAGKVVSGEELVLRTIRTRQAKLVLLSADASANTAKRVTDKCRYYDVPCLMVSDRHVLGRAIGKEARVTLAITDAKLAENIQHHLAPNKQGGIV